MRSLQPVLKTARFLWGRARPRLSSREAAKECSPQRKPWVGGATELGFFHSRHARNRIPVTNNLY